MNFYDSTGIRISLKLVRLEMESLRNVNLMLMGINVGMHATIVQPFLIMIKQTKITMGLETCAMTMRTMMELQILKITVLNISTKIKRIKMETSKYEINHDKD